MIGAIIGDIAGSRFERHNCKHKDFELMHRHCSMTDDSMMTLAVAKAILDCSGDCGQLENKAVEWMQHIGRRHPSAGYGGAFRRWLDSPYPHPYNSFGNGAAMRVSACGFAASSLEEAVELSRAVTCVTHDHPEGLKAAAAVSSAIWMALHGSEMAEIRAFITENYYPIDFTIDGIRDSYHFDATCQGSVPQAFEAFFESTGFEDAIRTAVSIGGDSDTIAAIAGGMAEAYYGVPAALRERALTYFRDAELRQILDDFERVYPPRAER